MAYRLQFSIAPNSLDTVRQHIDLKIAPIMQDALEAIANHAKQNLSGVPFESRTGTHVINKRSGKGAASVQVQYPYGSPYRGRVFASALSQYPGNPEAVNYLAVLEYGRGEIRPKYTPSMKFGRPDRARLTIPGGPFGLVSGQNGFRGQTGRYRFAKSIPPMKGKYWLEAAANAAQKELPDILNHHLNP